MQFDPRCGSLPYLKACKPLSKTVEDANPKSSQHVADTEHGQCTDTFWAVPTISHTPPVLQTAFHSCGVLREEVCCSYSFFSRATNFDSRRCFSSCTGKYRTYDQCSLATSWYKSLSVPTGTTCICRCQPCCTPERVIGSCRAAQGQVLRPTGLFVCLAPKRASDVALFCHRLDIDGVIQGGQDQRKALDSFTGSNTTGGFDDKGIDRQEDATIDNPNDSPRPKDRSRMGTSESKCK